MGDWIVSDKVWNENVEELGSNPSSGNESNIFEYFGRRIEISHSFLKLDTTLSYEHHLTTAFFLYIYIRPSLTVTNRLVW